MMTEPSVLDSWSQLIPLLGSGIVAIVLSLAFVMNRNAIKVDSDAKYAQLLRDLDKDITELENSEKNISSLNEFLDYAIDFTNNLERIAYLHNKKKIPDDIIDYFEYKFSYGMALDEFVEKHKRAHYEDVDAGVSFREYCKTHNIKPADLTNTLISDKIKQFDPSTS